MINLRLVSRVVSIILIVVALSMATPIVWALVDGETGTVGAFAWPVVVVLIGCGAWVAISERRDDTVSTRDGFLMVSLGWVLASFIGALPFWLSGAIPSFVDALFETMSGFTTTGASILTDIESLPRSILFWRSLTHWLGGMGIIVLMVAVFPLLGIGGFHLMKAETPGPRVDKMTPKVAETAKILWLSYIVLSVAETVLLMVGGMNLFDALTHTFGTMATGGFSPRNTSVGHYGSAWIDVVITVFMVLAGANFVLYYKLVTGRIGSMLRDGELRAYLGIFVGASVVAAFALHRGGAYDSVGTSLRYASFQVASILTTTGFATADFDGWPALAQMVLFALMWVGGSSGSTGGGMKVVRVITMVKQGWNEMRYHVYPRGVFTIRLSGERLRKDIVYTISGFVMLYVTTIIVTSVVVAIDGHDILTSLTTALATLGNIGPGFGGVGPTRNYAAFSDWLKVFLTFIMMVGRLEIYTVLVLFTRRYWRVQ